MWQWIKQVIKNKKIEPLRKLVWIDSHGEHWRSDGNYWCPYCERWVENGMFSEGGEWQRNRISFGGGESNTYDIGACKKCGAVITNKSAKQMESEIERHHYPVNC
jgi:hypothetical protein